MFSEVKRVSFSWKPLIVTSGRWWVVSGAGQAAAFSAEQRSKSRVYKDRRAGMANVAG